MFLKYQILIMAMIHSMILIYINLTVQIINYFEMLMVVVYQLLKQIITLYLIHLENLEVFIVRPKLIALGVTGRMELKTGKIMTFKQIMYGNFV